MNDHDATSDTPGRGVLPGRVMGIDLGSVRVGIALSDPRGVLASPWETLKREGSDEVTVDQILAIATGEEVSTIVIGIPVNLNPAKNVADEAMKKFKEVLESKTSLPVIGFDERFSTVMASKRLRESGHNSRSMKSRIDAIAATEILQNFLDSRG
jgi:putative Holliday junction resolvase